MKKLHRIKMIAFLAFSIFILTACGLMDLYRDISGGEQVQATLTAIASEKAVEPTQIEETQASPTAVEQEPTITQTSQGKIMGQLAYPSEFLPPQRVVAFDTDDSDTYFVTEVQTGRTFTLEVPPGTYYVLAYLINPSHAGASSDWYAAYSQAVECGLTTECEDHSLVMVEVQPGETVTEINPIDWYLPTGEDVGWPTDPLKPERGAITGALGYGSEYIPPMRVVAFDVHSEGYYYVDTLRNQETYEITDLPPGTYNVLAYVREEGPELSGGYSHFVTCGMTVDCSDHSLIDVSVYPGEVTEDVDPIDFYAQSEEINWPENPTQ